MASIIVTIQFSKMFKSTSILKGFSREKKYYFYIYTQGSNALFMQIIQINLYLLQV